MILVGLMEGLSGFGLDMGLRGDSNSSSRGVTKDYLEPRFADLNGSLFLALQTDIGHSLEEGTVVDFVFKRQTIKSFHVNGANQDVLNQGEADVLVMIHQDLALALKTEKLLEIKISGNGRTAAFKVGEIWAPHTYLSKL